MHRRAKAKVLDRMFEELQRAQVVRIKIEAVSLDSTSIKGHPDGTGRAQKRRPAVHRQVPTQMEHHDSYGCRGCSNGRDLLLVAGLAHGGPLGRRLLQSLVPTSRVVHLPMDTAYEGSETRQLALDLGSIPVVPPSARQVDPWEYDREIYRRRNEVERLSRRSKGFRRIFSRFEKLDAMLLAFLCFVLVVDGVLNIGAPAHGRKNCFGSRAMEVLV